MTKYGVRSALLALLLGWSAALFAVEPVDVNTASAVELAERLQGIGASKAAAIVAYREQHGPFASVEELVAVKGIGDALLARNRDRLRVAQATPTQ
ncbi:ComEA family DNA-binding protein [Motiliproteus sediminis]|uniref:ComEA family DNA-binding protein n=1 Tax=Motiliproteus sediminis TaxID=1468178 RepID=UPI001AEFD405|nr:helix-hairpin-helix domain-containing protein [Motiliproteus sediminis]